MRYTQTICSEPTGPRPPTCRLFRESLGPTGTPKKTNEGALVRALLTTQALKDSIKVQFHRLRSNEKFTRKIFLALAFAHACQEVLVELIQPSNILRELGRVARWDALS